MSTDLMPFAYADTEVRVVMIDNNPWFVLADLCRVLGISDVSIVRRRLDDALCLTHPIADALGRTQQATIVSEPGMYEVVIRSDKPGAVEFRRWITGEVLPTIRRTGSYGQPVERLTPLEYARSLVAAEERAELAQARAAELEEKVAADAPLVERARRHASGTGMVSRTQFFREVKAWAQERGVVVKRDEVNAFLSTAKLGLFVRGNRGDSGQATAWAIEKGYADNDQGTADNGHNYATGKLTARGQEYAWERIVRHIDANGTLELPRQIGAAS